MSTEPNLGRAAEGTECRGPEARARLLFVDDEPTMREVASAALAGHGYEIVTAEDGLDALRRLADLLPDVVISDLTMPRMSGFELLEIVRERFPLVPVIAVSGEFAGNKLPAGVLADAFLSKGGFTIDELCSKIAEVISVPPIRRRA